MKYIFSILRRFSFVKTVLFTFCRFDISCKNIFNLSNNLVILPGKHALSMCILRSLWSMLPNRHNNVAENHHTQKTHQKMYFSVKNGLSITSFDLSLSFFRLVLWEWPHHLDGSLLPNWQWHNAVTTSTLDLKRMSDIGKLMKWQLVKLKLLLPESCLILAPYFTAIASSSSHNCNRCYITFWRKPMI